MTFAPPHKYVEPHNSSNSFVPPSFEVEPHNSSNSFTPPHKCVEPHNSSNSFTPPHKCVENIKVVRNPKGKIVLELPQDTLLDNIVNDLWPIISKYRYQYPFVFCEYDDQLPDFRQITKKEFGLLKSSFLDYYGKNGGVPNIQNINHTGDTIYVVIDNCYLSDGDMFIRCVIDGNKIIIMANIVKNDFMVSDNGIYDTEIDLHLVLMVPKD
jgi:hypothetical protein